MILVINVLMESHTFAKYGIWYSGQRAAGTEQVHSGEKIPCICITESQFKSTFMQQNLSIFILIICCKTTDPNPVMAMFSACSYH